MRIVEEKTVGLRKAIEIMAYDQGIAPDLITRKNSDESIKACVNAIGGVNTVRAHLALRSLNEYDLEDICFGDEDNAYCFLLSQFGEERAAFINECLNEAFASIGNWR